jgi:hypothetical protein
MVQHLLSAVLPIQPTSNRNNPPATVFDDLAAPMELFAIGQADRVQTQWLFEQKPLTTPN